jgi:hypothetical protein
MEEAADETSDVKVGDAGVIAVLIVTSGSPIYIAPISKPSLKPDPSVEKCDESYPNPK